MMTRQAPLAAMVSSLLSRRLHRPRASDPAAPQRYQVRAHPQHRRQQRVLQAEPQRALHRRLGRRRECTLPVRASPFLARLQRCRQRQLRRSSPPPRLPLHQHTEQQQQLLRMLVLLLARHHCLPAAVTCRLYGWPLRQDLQRPRSCRAGGQRAQQQQQQ